MIRRERRLNQSNSVIEAEGSVCTGGLNTHCIDKENTEGFGMDPSILSETISSNIQLVTSD